MEFNKEELGYIAKLQQKKNKLRLKLAELGVQKKGKTNDHNHYQYFSEAQYKDLFTDLFSANGLELHTTILSVEDINGSQGMPYARRIKEQFNLYDIETGFHEESIFFGEAFDIGDKAVFKAYTGCYKYYIANTFNVATGDDPEADKGKSGYDSKDKYPKKDATIPAKKNQPEVENADEPKPIKSWQLKTISGVVTDDKVKGLFEVPIIKLLLEGKEISRLTELTDKQADIIIDYLSKLKK